MATGNLKFVTYAVAVRIHEAVAVAVVTRVSIAARVVIGVGCCVIVAGDLIQTSFAYFDAAFVIIIGIRIVVEGFRVRAATGIGNHAAIGIEFTRTTKGVGVSYVIQSFAIDKDLRIEGSADGACCCQLHEQDPVVDRVGKTVGRSV